MRSSENNGQAFSLLFVDIVSSINIAHDNLDIFKDFELYSSF